jgi:hypothetical protein
VSVLLCLRRRQAGERIERPEVGRVAVPPRLAVCEDERVAAVAAELRVVPADLVEAEGLEGVVEEGLPLEPLAGVEVEQVTATRSNPDRTIRSNSLRGASIVRERRPPPPRIAA